MSVTCQLVPLRHDEVQAVRSDPIAVGDLIDWDEPSDRWVDLDQAWGGLVLAFEAHDRRDTTLLGALIPGPPLFDESEQGGQTIMLADADMVGAVADALERFDPAQLFPRRRSWRRRAPAMEPEYLADHLEVLLDCCRRAAADGEAVAVVIG